MSLFLMEKSIKINNQLARFYQSKVAISDKPAAHFYGGNGFVVGAYEPLLKQLAQVFDISSLAMRGYWYDKPTSKKLTRMDDAKMLIEFIEKIYDAPIIGIGHSQGATATAIAAAMRPDLFSAIYLVEPVTFTKQQTLLYKLIPDFIKLKNEPFKSTLKKQQYWQSDEAYYQYLRGHKAYKRVSDDLLHIYAKNSLIKRNDGGKGFELLFSPKQELASYFGTPFIDNALKTLNKTEVYYHIIKGKPSLFINEKVRKSWQKFVPKTAITVLPQYGHLLPIEAPECVAQIIIEQNQSKNSTSGSSA